MNIKGFKLHNNLIINTLRSIPNINKNSKLFIVEILTLFLTIKGRVNFLQLERHSSSCEQRYRQQFEKPFPFLQFNAKIVKLHSSQHNIIAFDPSYISKSGKKTPGLSCYWSGCAGKAKWGLEISGIAAVDIENNTAFHLEAIQTMPDEKDEKWNLISWYLSVLKNRKDSLLDISKYLVADAYFSKILFVSGVIDLGFEMIGRLRDDADLKYIVKPSSVKKRGRPRLYGNRVDPKNIDLNYFTLISESKDTQLYSAIVYSKSLKRNIRIVHATYIAENGKCSHKLYFTTDLKLSAHLVISYYKARFQIEFLYRDGKQFTGLCDSQARSVQKLHFHFNTSLTAINVAKVEHWLSIPIEQRDAFSMSNIKTKNHNQLLLSLFFDTFGINPNLPKNRKLAAEILNFGSIAA